MASIPSQRSRSRPPASKPCRRPPSVAPPTTSSLPAPSPGRAIHRPPAADGVTVAVALSGGGFRATLAGLGVLQLLADCGLLGNVRYSSSVSGGSVANGLFAHHYDELAAEGFSGDAFDRIVVAPCIERISGTSFTRKLFGNAWRIVGPKTRVNLLADSFADWFYGHQPLAETPAAMPVRVQRRQPDDRRPLRPRTRDRRRLRQRLRRHRARPTSASPTPSPPRPPSRSGSTRCT